MTTKSDLIDPEVLSVMVSAKLPKAIIASNYTRFDSTLEGQPGDTISLPQYNYVGDADDLAEGADATPKTLTTSKVSYTVKKAVVQIPITDEALSTAYGDPVQEIGLQLTKSVASKIDADIIAALQGATQTYTANAVISYDGIVDAIDVFDEERNTEKIIYVNPKQVTKLRKDTNFISADKYPDNKVVETGEIGMIANCHVVPTKRIVLTDGKYNCPIVKIGLADTDNEIPAATVYVKKRVSIETERNLKNYTTLFGACEHYVASLTNASKVVKAVFNAAA